MNYQMGDEETTFKQLMAQQTGQDASVFENMTIEQIGEMMHVELKSFRQEKEDEDGNKAEVTVCRCPSDFCIHAREWTNGER